jgi:drug/metabolite transporter (DMT)-like permease
VPLLLAGLAGVAYGIADFLGGLASTTLRAERVAVVAQAVGLVVTLGLLPVVGASPSGADLAWGAAAGVGGGAGIAALYRALAIGPMNVAAPTAAVVGSVVPVGVGLSFGERPGPVALAGVACALLAVWLVGSAPHPDASPGRGRRAALVGALAGAGLGAATVAFGRTSAEAGLWPLAAAKAATVALLLPVGGADGRGGAPNGRGPRLALAAGLADAAATVLLVLAVQRGPLSLVGVLVSLYPASTVVLARVVLAERVGRAQALGLGLAAAAVVMIAAG